MEGRKAHNSGQNGIKYINYVVDTIPLTPFQTLLGAVLPSAASTGAGLDGSVFVDLFYFFQEKYKGVILHSSRWR